MRQVPPSEFANLNLWEQIAVFTVFKINTFYETLNGAIQTTDISTVNGIFKKRRKEKMFSVDDRRDLMMECEPLPVCGPVKDRRTSCHIQCFLSLTEIQRYIFFICNMTMEYIWESKRWQVGDKNEEVETSNCNSSRFSHKYIKVCSMYFKKEYSAFILHLSLT